MWHWEITYKCKVNKYFQLCGTFQVLSSEETCTQDEANLYIYIFLIIVQGNFWNRVKALQCPNPLQLFLLLFSDILKAKGSRQFFCGVQWSRSLYTHWDRVQHCWEDDRSPFPEHPACPWLTDMMVQAGVKGQKHSDWFFYLDLPFNKKHYIQCLEGMFKDQNMEIVNNRWFEK